MGENLAAPGQRRHRRIGAADAAAADGDQHIARCGIERRRDRCGIARFGFDEDNARARGPRVLRNQLRCRRMA